MRRLIPIAAALALLPATAHASHSQPALDISKLAYQPHGHFKPGEPIPSPDDPPKPTKGAIFNPSGFWNAYDNNVFHSLSLPYRAPGDVTEDDPYGNGGDSRYGFCGGDTGDPRPRKGPLARLAGACPNHQREYARYYAETMKEILGDFGVSIRTYEFDSPGSDNAQAGRAVNTAAVIPGTDHPDEQIVIGAHYDQTDEGPTSAWDSSEGHAEIIRAAKLLADYWRATGTRPSATIKLIPWDSEESGTVGSQAYIDDNVVPGQEANVRAYLNVDPCTGVYPAYRFGNGVSRAGIAAQLANPDAGDDPLLGRAGAPEEARERINAFNQKVMPRLEQLFDHLDDKVPTLRGEVETFVSTSEAAQLGVAPDLGARDGLFTTLERDVLFSSDWANFEQAGIPFLNPGPDTGGPGTQGGINASESQIFHTPFDNLQTLNAFTSTDPTGLSASPAWQKGMEMCAQLLAWFSLQPDMGGAQKAGKQVVAYFEALPNEARRGKPVKFDADGSYRYLSPGSRRKAAAKKLRFKWEFGDGATAKGVAAEHVYPNAGIYRARLTVSMTDKVRRRGKVRRKTVRDTMVVPVTVR